MKFVIRISPWSTSKDEPFFQRFKRMKHGKKGRYLEEGRRARGRIEKPYRIAWITYRDVWSSSKAKAASMSNRVAKLFEGHFCQYLQSLAR